MSVFWGGVINHGNRERQSGIFALFFFLLRSTWLDVRMKILGSVLNIYIYIPESVWNFKDTDTLRDKGMERVKAWYFLLFERCT